MLYVHALIIYLNVREKLKGSRLLSYCDILVHRTFSELHERIESFLNQACFCLFVALFHEADYCVPSSFFLAIIGEPHLTLQTSLQA